MRIRGKAWLALAVVVALIWRHCGSDESPATPTTSSTDQHRDNELARFIAHLPTPAQLKLHPVFITTGELRLEGQTIDGDKVPIANAVVTLNGDRVVTSGADGSFFFDHLAEGDYVVSAAKDTFYGEDKVTLNADSDPDELEMKSGPSVRLHIVDRNGAAIRDAKISASRRDAISDADGNATLRGLELDHVRLEVSADGFGPIRTDVETGDDARTMTSKTIVLQPGTAFGGTVVDEQNKPVPGASVVVAQGRWRDHIDADDHGVFRVPFLAAGKVTLSGSSDQHLVAPDLSVEHDGLHDKLDVVVHVVLGARVTGIVVDPQGKPVAGASVNVGDGYGKCDEYGKFLVKGITPGAIDVVATTELGSSVIRKITLDRIAEIRIEIVESSIAGVVRDTHGNPVEDASIAAKGIDNGGSGYVRSDEYGKYDLGGLPPGEYEVSVARDKDRMGTPDHGIHVRTTNRSLALTLSDLGAIAGRVILDGQPVAYYGVAVTDDPEPSNPSGEPFRTEDGKFVQKDLRPGAYSIVIAGQTFQRKVLTNVQVAEGRTTQMGDITVEHGRVIRGTVRDGRGQPIGGAAITASARSGDLDSATVDNQIRGTRTATSDALGNYELGGLDPADDSIWIQAMHDDDMAGPRELKPEDSVVDLVIVRTGAIAGRVINARPGWVAIRVDAVPEGASFRIDVEPDDSFHLEHVPPGDYAVSLGYGVTFAPVQIHVESSTTTPVTLALSEQPITLDVASTACDHIALRSGTGGYVAYEECTSGVAKFADVAPGTYQVCRGYDECESITVTELPTQQQVLLQIQPPAPEQPSTEQPEPDPGVSGETSDP
jgi:protocatechuate 3,4-dioxygenase beta subunit